MSRTPSLISGCNGKPVAYQATRKVECYSCESNIVMGEHVVKIPIRSGMRTTPRIHCLKCLSAILVQTQKDLVELEKLLAK